MKNLILTVDEKLEYLSKLKQIVEIVECDELEEGQKLLINLIKQSPGRQKDIFHWATDSYATDLLRENIYIEDDCSEESIEDMEFTREEINEEIREIYKSKLSRAEKALLELRKYKGLKTINELVEVCNALKYLSFEYFESDSIEMETVIIKYKSEMQIIKSIEKWSTLFQYTGLSKDVIIITDIYKEDVWVLPVSPDVNEESIEDVKNKLENFLEENPSYEKYILNNFKYI